MGIWKRARSLRTIRAQSRIEVDPPSQGGLRDRVRSCLRDVGVIIRDDTRTIQQYALSCRFRKTMCKATMSFTKLRLRPLLLSAKNSHDTCRVVELSADLQNYRQYPHGARGQRG